MTSVALLISGHTRCIEETAANIRALADALKSDVFIHTWEDVNTSEGTWRVQDQYTEVLNQKWTYIEETLMPKAWCIENEHHVSQGFAPLLADRTRLRATQFMVHGIKRVFDVLHDYTAQTQQAYDIVVRYRFDIRCEDIAAMVADIQQLRPACLLAPDHNWAGTIGACSDICFAAHNSDYAQFVQRLSLEITGRINAVVSPEKIIPELLITDIMRSTGLPIQAFHTEFSLIRKGGLVEQVFPFRHGFHMHAQAHYITSDIISQLQDPQAKRYLRQRWFFHSGWLVAHFFDWCRAGFRLLSRIKNSFKR